jgi:hypothetical protein
MQRAHLTAVGCLSLLIACTNPSTDVSTTTTSATLPLTPTTATATTTPQAPTDCREAPQMPACRPDHGVDRPS